MKRSTTKGRERPYYDSWEQEADACMDYLHGDAKGDEYEAACYYEYARESPKLRSLATHRDAPEKWMADDAHWIAQHPWLMIWHCPAFPGKPWNRLRDGEHEQILACFAASGVQPLRVMELGLLASGGVLDALKKRGRPDTSTPAGRATVNKPAVVEMPERFAGTLVMFNLDFKHDSRKRMCQRFAAWLDLPENKQRFGPASNATGTTGRFKDRLKDLAVWRLYRKLGFAEMLGYTQTHRKRDRGTPRPFHDARQGQSGKLPLEQVRLCSEESFAIKAKRRAEDFLTEILPWEFGEYAKHEERLLKHWLQGLRKISKRSS